MSNTTAEAGVASPPDTSPAGPPAESGSETTLVRPANQDSAAPAAEDTEDTEASEEEAPEGEPADSANPPKKRQMKRATRIRVIAIAVVAVLVGLFFLGRYILDTRNYVTTDNAQVDGNQISVNAPATGTLVDWKGQQGAQLRKNAPVGRIQIQGGFVQPQMVIRAPGDGVIAVNNGVEGSFVNAGTQLAIAYDGSGVYVTARVDETEIDQVQVGRAVNISVDAFSSTPLAGHVAEIKTGAAGVFSLFPQSNTSGNFQKVTQVIPVRITIDDLKGLSLAPGMNVTVKIHRS